jgi:hypothetical protein
MPVGAILCSTPEPGRVPLRYKGYELHITHFRWFDAKGMAVHLNFRTPKKWWHADLRTSKKRWHGDFRTERKWWHGPFKDQNAELTDDLMRICTSEISGLDFAVYLQKIREYRQEPQEISVFHDSRALNEKWQWGFDISPLMVAPDAHHGRCFVEFFFWGGGYVRESGSFPDSEAIVLRWNWLDFAFDVSRDIEQRSGLIADSPHASPGPDPVG